MEPVPLACVSWFQPDGKRLTTIVEASSLEEAVVAACGMLPRYVWPRGQVMFMFVPPNAPDRAVYEQNAGRLLSWDECRILFQLEGCPCPNCQAALN